jgi:hypothetical protein
VRKETVPRRCRGGAETVLGRCRDGVGPVVSGQCRAGVGPEAGGEGRATLTNVATNGVLSTCSCTAVLLSPSRHSGERKRVRNDGFFISCANTPSGSCGAMLSMACRKATPAASPTSRSLDPPSLSPPSPPERAPKVDAGAAGVSCSIRPADSAAASSNSCTAGWMRPVRASPRIRTSILQWRAIAVASRAGELGPICPPDAEGNRPMMRCPREEMEPLSSRATQSGPPW